MSDRRTALLTPHAREHEASLAARMARGVPPSDLAALLRWYAAGWDAEVPMTLHRPEVWRDHGQGAQGGSRLGSPAWSDPFRRYMEGTPSETDQDGSYARPMHAALSRLGRRHPLTVRALFAVAQSGYDWRGVADRGHWAGEMFAIYLERALLMLWAEHRDDVVRLQ